MATEASMEKIKRELHRAVDSMRSDLTRVEILTAALSAFSRPVPDYEPAFHHVQRIKLSAHELGATEQH